MLFIVSGKCEVLIKCQMPVKRNGKAHQPNRKHGSSDSADPLMNSSDSASSVALTEENKKARQILVDAAAKASRFIKTLERGTTEMLVGHRTSGNF